MNTSFQRGAAKTAGHTFTATLGVVLAATLAATLSGCTGGGGATSGTAASSAGSGSDTLATVGTSKVTRGDLGAFLEAQGGARALPYLIDTQLVFENLKSKGLDVSDAEVDADLARRQANDPTLARLVTAGGLQVEMLKTQIKRELAIQKILTGDIKPTDAQIQSFFKTYHAYYDAPAKIKVGLLFASTKTRADLLARQLAQKTKTFAALVAEQKKANDPVASKSTEAREQAEPLENFPPAVAAQLQKMPKGGTTGAQPLNVGLPTPVFVIFRKADFVPAKPADLKTLRDSVETDYKLAEVAKKTVAQGGKNPPFLETLSRTQKYLQSQNPGGTPPRLHDVLAFIIQTPAANVLTSLRTAGTVQISDPNYIEVGKQYQAPPAANGTPGAPSEIGATPSADKAPPEAVKP